MISLCMLCDDILIDEDDDEEDDEYDPEFEVCICDACLLDMFMEYAPSLFSWLEFLAVTFSMFPDAYDELTVIN